MPISTDKTVSTDNKRFIRIIYYSFPNSVVSSYPDLVKGSHAVGYILITPL